VPVAVPEIPFPHRIFAVGLLLASVLGASGQEASPAALRLETLPERFFQVQDEAGFLWQALDNGALISGDAQYLQSGMNLIVDGEPFAPSSGTMREPGGEGERIDLRLEESRGAATLVRDLWFDTRRSGVRVLDTVTNAGSSERSFEVVLRTTYPFAWQTLHAAGGRMLGAEPGAQLGEDDRSLAVRFSPADGRHDTYFLFGGKGGLRPTLRTSANSRELVLVYELTVPAGETRGLLHWVLQRNLPEAGAESAVFGPFLQREQLLQPGVEPREGATVANFAPSAFPVEAGVPSRLRSLVALNDFAERVGSQRRSEDLIWQGPTAQTAGSLRRDGSFTVEAVALGRVSFPLADLAALRGGAGQGTTPLFFLRDGRVLAALSWEGEMLWRSGPEGADSPVVPIDPSEVNLLLLATAAQDGSPPERATHFVELSWGSVVAVSSRAEDKFDWIAPFGLGSSSWLDLVEMERSPSPVPHWRLRLADGSLLAAMPSSGEMEIRSISGGDISVPRAAVERIWRAGENPRLREAGAENWVDFSEVPSGLGPSEGFLLAGNLLVSGGFGPGGLLLLDGDAQVRLEAGDILSAQRAEGPGRAHLVEVELVGGDRVVGEFAEPYLRIFSRGEELEIPSSLVLGFRKEGTIP
jgi:hypothetical protein